MPKFKQYAQKFRSEWVKDDLFKNWLCEVKTNPEKAHCKLCKTDIRAKFNDLLNHMKSKKHINSTSLKAMSMTHFCMPKNENERKKEMKMKNETSILEGKNETSILEGNIALFLACHCAIINCDHMVDKCKNTITDSKITSKLVMHRTKCFKIIKNVLSKHFVEDLIEDIDNGKFSLLLDESNDITVHKMLGISIIYYSTKNKKVVSTFLNIVELEECNADGIIDALKKELENKKLALNKMIAIGTDNASVMVGIHNGVYQKLKKEIPSLILIRCICHSLQLAISHTSSACLPRNLEFLIAETHKWFSLSSSRQLAYKNLYQTLNDGESPLKIPSDCKTRWLSIEPAVGRIITQWMELKTHFKIMRNNEKCYTSEILFEMYKDEKNLAYLLFLQPILVEVHNVNKLFESKATDKTKLLDDLVLLVNSVACRLILPTSKVNPLTSNIDEYLDPKPYLGYRCERKLEDLKSCGKLTTDEEICIRESSQNFLLTLFKQLKQRLPENINILKNVSVLSAEKALNPVKQSLVSLMEFMGASVEEISASEYQWTKLHLVDWNSKIHTESFWSEVLQYKDASGSNPFKELSEFAISTLILPHSNAEVERVFSSMNNVKLKLRNKMQLNMLSAILSIKFGLLRNNKCCHNYKIPEKTLNAIGTLQAYSGKGKELEEASEECFHHY